MPEPPELPPIAQAPLSVLLPAYQEQAHVEETLNGWLTYLNRLERDYEIVLVDDGSSDATAALAESLAAGQPRLRVFRHPLPRGFGACLRTGLEAAQHPLVFYTTCDLQYQPSDLQRLLELIDQVDLVSGYRTAGRAPGKQRWQARCYRWLVRLFFGVRLRDVDCAFKLFRRTLFGRVPIQSDGAFVHAEIVAKANFLGCYMNEVAVGYRPRQRPVPWEEDPCGRQTLREAYRVFSHPDFGPVVVPLEVDQSPR